MVEDVKVRTESGNVGTLLEALTENIDIIVETAAMLSVICLVRHARSPNNAFFTSQHRNLPLYPKLSLKSILRGRFMQQPYRRKVHLGQDRRT